MVNDCFLLRFSSKVHQAYFTFLLSYSSFRVHSYNITELIMTAKWYVSSKYVRSCAFVSGSLQSLDQFLRDGCDNCEPYLKLKRNREAINECTSQSFDGYVMVI